MKGPDEKRSEFKVVLDGIKLSEKQERSISAAIQGVVAGHLAELDFEGDDLGGILEIGGRFLGWPGGRWLRIDASQREELENVLQRRG